MKLNEKIPIFIFLLLFLLLFYCCCFIEALQKKNLNSNLATTSDQPLMLKNTKCSKSLTINDDVQSSSLENVFISLVVYKY